MQILSCGPHAPQCLHSPFMCSNPREQELQWYSAGLCTEHDPAGNASCPHQAVMAHFCCYKAYPGCSAQDHACVMAGRRPPCAASSRQRERHGLHRDDHAVAKQAHTTDINTGTSICMCMCKIRLAWAQTCAHSILAITVLGGASGAGTAGMCSQLESHHITGFQVTALASCVRRLSAAARH